MSARCNHERRHDMSTRIRKFKRQFFEVNELDEADLRERLADFSKAFGEKAHCNNVTAWMQANEDLYALKLRRGSTILNDDEDAYIPVAPNTFLSPGNKRCFHCGWLSGSGTVTINGKFFCIDPACNEALNTYNVSYSTGAKHEHLSKGLCTYTGDLNKPHDKHTYCTIKAGEDQLCDVHRGLKCQVFRCSEQAVLSLWIFGSLADEFRRCEMHANVAP